MRLKKHLPNLESEELTNIKWAQGEPTRFRNLGICSCREIPKQTIVSGRRSDHGKWQERTSGLETQRYIRPRYLHYAPIEQNIQYADNTYAPTLTTTDETIEPIYEDLTKAKNQEWL